MLTGSVDGTALTRHGADGFHQLQLRHRLLQLTREVEPNKSFGVQALRIFVVDQLIRSGADFTLAYDETARLAL